MQKPLSFAFDFVASNFLSPAWRNWQTRWTQNPVAARSCGFEPLRRQSVLTCRIGKVTASLPSRCGAKKRSPCLLRGKINQSPTSRCSHRRDENTCNEPCSPAFYACKLERELQCSFVNGKNGHEVASQPREFVTTRWSVILPPPTEAKRKRPATRWPNFAGLIGGLFSHLFSCETIQLRMRRISLRIFL